MARLSISDLNNLSGVSDEELNNLYNEFRNAHTKLLNDIHKWIDVFNTSIPEMYKHEARSCNDDIKIYRTARRMYYEGSIIIDNTDLLDEFTNQYLSILSTLNNKDTFSNVMSLIYMLRQERKKMIERIPECYDLYSAAYSRLDEMEDTYEG